MSRSRQSVEVSGLKEVRAALRKLEGGTDDLKATNAEAAEVVRDEARSLVPVRSGTLRGSLRSTGQVAAGVVRAGKKNVPYAGPIHFGWARRNIAPQPYLYDAADRRGAEVVETYRQAILDRAKEAGLDTKEGKAWLAR